MSHQSMKQFLLWKRDDIIYLQVKNDRVALDCRMFIHWLLLTPRHFLTHCGLVTSYDDIELGQHRIRKWFVTWWHQAITWTNVYFSSVRFCGSHPRAISLWVPKLLFCIMFEHYTFKSTATSLRGLWVAAPRDAYICQETNQHWLRWWLVAWTAPCHYLNQWWNIVDWTLRNKRQGNFNPNWHIFIQENASLRVVWEMAATLSRGR